MVDFGKLAKKAKGLADQHGDKIAKGVNKATDLVDEKTKGKYREKLNKVDEAAQRLDKTAARRDEASAPEPDADEPGAPQAGSGG